MEYLFYYMAPTPNNIWEYKDYQNTANFGQSTNFFVKTEPRHIYLQILVNYFTLFLLISFLE